MIIIPVNADDIPAVVLPVPLTINDAAVQIKSTAQFDVGKRNAFRRSLTYNKSFSSEKKGNMYDF